MAYNLFSFWCERLSVGKFANNLNLCFRCLMYVVLLFGVAGADDACNAL